MWKIYAILMLWTQSINSQYVDYITNSQGSILSDNGKNTFKSNAYSEYDHITLTSANNDTISSSPQLSVRSYNSRNSDGNANNLAENHSLLNKKEASFNTPRQIANKPIDEHLNVTPDSATWKVPAGESFNAKLFDIMTSKNQHTNLVYSPISLQTLLAFICNMSGGKLYEELVQLLAISNNRTFVAKTFENILQSTLLNTPTTKLIMANKLYYDYQFGSIDKNLRNLAKKSFATEIEEIDFLPTQKAANIINSWVSETTRNLIRNIVEPSTISSDTSALLLNSIYFKSEWLTKFDASDTESQKFFVTKQTKVPVHMMHNEDVFRYGDFPTDLQASVVELPYKTSNLTMLLILPKDLEGLANLERKLRFYDLETISQKLKRETVTIKLPRFKVEFEMDMIKPLQQLGLKALFNNVGSINLFRNQQKPLNVDQFKHKSFINVNEAGTEAAATTVAKYIPLSIPINMKYFTADHPFVFAIRDSNTTFFIGHVVEF